MKKDYLEKNDVEAIAPIYFSSSLTGVNQKYNQFAIQEVIPFCKGPNILEMGCGKGLWTEALIGNFQQITIVEMSEFLIGEIQKKFGNNLTCHNCAFEDFQTEEKFDTILSAHILEHVCDPVELLKKSSGWLKANGVLIIVVPNADSLHRRIGVSMGILKRVDAIAESDKLIGHRRVYTLTKLVDEIAKSGLNIIKLGGIGLKPFSNAQMEGWSDSIMNAFLEIGRDLPPDCCSQLYAVCAREGK